MKNKLKMLVGNNTSHTEIKKIANRIIAKKGKRWTWELARRISRIISNYPISNNRRQKLAELAIMLRNYCKIN